MCKYAMYAYKPHYACFNCRKTFKRRLLSDINRGQATGVAAKCPQCSSLTAYMGYDFESPKKNDLKAWAHIKSLYSVGITFFSCGCTGPGYIPNSKEKLIQYFEDLKGDYAKEIEFWRKRIEPVNERSIQSDLSRNFDNIHKIRFPSVAKGKIIKNEEGINFWIAKIREADEKLGILKLAN
jgi:DNA-directed RNA polymerase subunit RPC12/RpoP